MNGRRTWLRGLLVLAPVGALVLFEALLAVTGVAPRPRFFVTSGGRVYRPAEPGPWGPPEELCGPVEIAVPKDAGTLRLLVAGASTVRGYPYDLEISFADWLCSSSLPSGRARKGVASVRNGPRPVHGRETRGTDEGSPSRIDGTGEPSLEAPKK